MNQRKQTLLGLMSIVLSMSLVAVGCGKESDSGTTPKASVETAKPEAERQSDRDYVGEQLQSLLKLTATMCRSSWSKNSTLKSKMSNLTARDGRINSTSCLLPDKFPTFSRSMQTKPIWPAWADQGIIASISPDEIRKNDAELYESAGID